MKKIYSFLSILIAIHAMSQSGSLDLSFGNNGKVHTGFGSSNATANAVAVQPDGKIIVGGSAYTANAGMSRQIDTDNATLVRYHTNGTIDTSFGNEGIAMADYYSLSGLVSWNTVIMSVTLQSDGKIIVYAYKHRPGSGSNAILIRYNIDGSIDRDFGINGRVECNLSPVYGSNALVIQPNGKIVVLGSQYSNPSPNVFTTQFVLERYNSEGSIDTSFATNGRAVTSFGLGNDSARAITLQPDGKIIAVGSSFNARFAIARYTIDGILDTTFDNDGKLTTSFLGMACFVKVHADGRILVAGRTNSETSVNFTILRCNTNGSYDLSFDGDGIATNPENLFENDSYSFNSLSEQPDGKFLLTTTVSSESTASTFTVRRYNPDGTTDTAFGVNGKATTTIQAGYNDARSLAIQSDGKILVAGYSHPLSSSQRTFNVIRYDGNGTLDASFGSAGKARATFDSTNDESTVLLLQPNQKLIAIGTKRNYLENGYFYQDIALSRYGSDGNLDLSFGNAGKTISVFGSNLNSISKAILQPDGKIVLVNRYSLPFGNVYSYELIRYTNSGNLDLSFGNNGKAALDAETHTLLSQPDGKIIATCIIYDAQNNSTLIARRFNNDGTPDTTFDNDGTAFITGFFNGLSTAALQPDGKIIIAVSSFDSQRSGVSIIRLNTNGSLDNSIVNALTVVDNYWHPNAIFFQPGGKIIVAGRSASLVNSYDNFNFVAAQYNPDGSLDTTYGTNGVVVSYLGGTFQPYNIVRSVCLQPDGKFIVALGKYDQNPQSPSFNSYDFVIYRYAADGNRDSEFGTDGQVTTSFYTKYDEAFSMILQPDNKIIVAGTTDTGTNRDFAIARYENILALGTKDLHQDADLILYPNPVKDTFHIKNTAVNGIEVVDLSIYNMLGQIVYKSYGAELEVNTVNFSPGIYNVLIDTNKGMVIRKIIKE